MTLLIPADATHLLDGVFYRQPRTRDTGRPLLYWQENSAQWLEVRPVERARTLALDLHGRSVAFTRQY